MHLFIALSIEAIAAFTLGYLLRASHVNQQAEDYLRELHVRLSLAVKRDEAGLRADAANLLKELDGIVHRAL